MNLYHYTCTQHLPTILHYGYLRLTESNVSMHRAHAGEPVVWLTTDPAPAAGQHGLSEIKRRVRFTVNAPDAEPWMGTDLYRTMAPSWRDILIDTAGGRAQAQTWWVSRSPIARADWVSVTVDGEELPMTVPCTAFGLQA